MSTPPFELSESGFGSFMSQIEFRFHNSTNAKFEYDLVLPDEDQSPLDNYESGHFSFEEPSEDFKQKLLLAGGVYVPVHTSNGHTSEKSIVPRKRANMVDKKKSKPQKKKKKLTSKRKSSKTGDSSDYDTDTDGSDVSWTGYMYDAEDSDSDY